MNIQIVTVTVSSIVGIVAIVLTLLFMIKRFVRRRNMCNKLDAITPSDSKYGHKAVGLSYKQPIKFTLPAITVEPSDGSRAASSIPSESDTDRESTSTNVSIYSGGFVLPCGRQPSYGSYSISADEIDTELYLSESDEGHTSSSGATGLGRIGFSLQYTVIRQQLCVKVIGATGLPSNFIHKGSANPFVKLILHPEKSPKYLTKVHRNTTNPVFQEAFVFSAKLDGIEFRVLRISVWDYDKYSRKVPIGGVDVTLKDFGINSHLKDDLITEDVWKDLSSKETEKLKKGELFLSLSYKPEAATLTIGIIKAKNIEWPNTKGEKEHGWRYLVRVGVMNCVAESDLEICQKHMVEKTPTIGYFSPHSQLGKHFAQHFQKDVGHEENLLFQQLVEKLIQDASSLHLNPTYFQRTGFHSIQGIYRFWHHPPIKEVYILVDDRNSPVGNIVVIDALAHPHLKLVLTSKENRRLLNEITSQVGSFIVPALFISSENKVTYLIGGSSNVTSYLHQLKVSHDGEKNKELSMIEDVSSKNASPENENVVHNPPEPGPSKTDLRNALVYSLGNEVTLHQKINGEAFKALLSFVTILQKYFPANETETKFLVKLKTKLSVKNSINAAEWKELIRPSAKNEPIRLPHMVEWTSCKGSKPHFRGYPCSLWMLFHYITIQDYLTNKHYERYRPIEVLDSILGYVKYFFSCEECSRHFQTTASESMYDEVKRGSDAILWLWRTHNKVNVRLSSTKSEDPTHRKVQFPSMNLCRDCRYKVNMYESTWNLSTVFNFLIKFYDKNSLLNSKGGATIYNFQSKFSDMFNIFDIGLCIILYQVMIVLVCIFFIMLKYRSRRKFKRILPLWT